MYADPPHSITVKSIRRYRAAIHQTVSEMAETVNSTRDTIESSRALIRQIEQMEDLHRMLWRRQSDAAMRQKLTDGEDRPSR